MAASHGASWKAAVAVELLLYAAIIGGFLWAYVYRFHASIQVIPHHLGVVMAVAAVPACLRLIVWKFLSANSLARVLSAFLVVLPLVALTIWYVLVIVGLDSWGRVTTWPLIHAYVVQAPYLLSALGVMPWIPCTAALVVSIFAVWLVWRYFAPLDWARRVAKGTSRGGLFAIAIGLFALSAAHMHVSIRLGHGHPMEPMGVSFGVGRSQGLQSHIVSGSNVLDAREEEARHSYIIAKEASRRNLIVIVGDALRAEHMSIYGYSRRTTPKIEAFMLRYQSERAPLVRAACAESTCGLMALAASRPVSEMGSAPMTLQEVLRRNGYKVHFILGGDHTNFYGLDRMYGELDSYHDGSRQSRRYMNDDQLVLDEVEQLPEWTPGQSVAFQFHLMSTHGLGKRDPDLSPFTPSSNYYAWPGGSPKRAPTAADALHAVNHYDNGVVRFDQITDQILNTLRNKGYLSDALVVITGDHGEMLGENGYFSHQFGLSEAVLDIPLVIFRVGYSGPQFVNGPLAGQIDIAPTILHELEVPAPVTWKGRPLQLLWTPRELKIQQAQNFGIYHVDARGEVRKYLRDLDSGVESVTDPIDDPLGTVDLTSQTRVELVRRWRGESAAGMLNAAPN